MKTLKTLLLLIVAVALMTGCKSKQEKMNKELTEFIKKLDSVVIPLSRENNLASWNAAITGKPEDFKKSEDLQM